MAQAVDQVKQRVVCEGDWSFPRWWMLKREALNVERGTLNAERETLNAERPSAKDSAKLR